jgi:hypothetical protein
MPTGDLPGWKQVVAEDFRIDVPIGQFPGTVYGPVWRGYDHPYKDTSKHGRYLPGKVISVRDGILDMFIRTEGGVHMVAAPIARATERQRYGRYSVRFRSDPIPGYKVAWLLWPSSNVRDEGEIDFPEGDLDGRIAAFSHCVNDQRRNCFAKTTDERFPEWHTATTEWTPGRVTFFLDGERIGSTTNRIPSTPMKWVLQTETALGGTEPSDSARGHVQIDWAVAYAYRP